MILFILLLAIFSSSCQGEASLEYATVGIYAVHTGTGEILIDENSDKSLVPASALKILTTGAAIHLLGAESYFQTTLEYDGAIDATGTLQGNLYVKGGGDPCLGSDRIPSSLPLQKLIASWVDAVQRLGIVRIEGKVIADATRWEKALAVPSWAWEDLGNYYGAGACALSFHENSYSLIFKPSQQVGDDAIILRTEPPIPKLTFNNEVKTGPEGSGDRATIFGSEYSFTHYVRGTVPAGVEEFSIKGAIPDPAAYCVSLFATALQAKGIYVGNRTFFSKNERQTFHVTSSPSIAEIVKWTNHQSLNLYAESLLKKIGEIVFNEGSTEAGTKAITNFWHSQQVDLKGCWIADGSGLSRKNLITARQCVAVLQKMKESKVFPTFLQSLPQRDETIRGKDGCMSQICSYAGYMDDVVFAIIINHAPNQQESQEAVNRLLARLKASLQKRAVAAELR